MLATADVAELALAFLDEGLRSVPVLDEERLVGIVSRRDALRALARSDDEIGRDVRRLVDSYTLLDGLAVIPVAVFEFSLGVYLVVKGFKPSSPLMLGADVS